MCCSLIDLVFVSNLSCLSTCSVIPQLANSNYLRVSVTMKYHHVHRRVWQYKHADFVRANDLLCDLELHDNYTWSLWHPGKLVTFQNCLLGCYGTMHPQNCAPRQENLPWLNKGIIQLIRRRNLYFRKAHRSGNREDHEKFKQLRNKVVAKLKHAKRDFFTNLHPRSQKEFWKVVKSLNSKQNTLPILVSGNITATSDLDKANLLNTTFVNNFNYSISGYLVASGIPGGLWYTWWPLVYLVASGIPAWPLVYLVASGIPGGLWYTWWPLVYLVASGIPGGLWYTWWPLVYLVASGIPGGLWYTWWPLVYLPGLWYTCLASGIPGGLPDVVLDGCPTDILCTEDEIYDLLCTLDTTKANGHDEISAKMLKETAMSITPAVTKLFNISIRLGKLPDEWKIARVTPIPKVGNHSDPGNYLPISLLSILSKLLEKHMRNLLAKHFEEEYPLAAQQWGFTRGKSTTGAYWLLQTTGTDCWSMVMTSVLCSLITARRWYGTTQTTTTKAPRLQCPPTYLEMAYALSQHAHTICLCKWFVFQHLTRITWGSSGFHTRTTAVYCVYQWYHYCPTVWWQYAIVCGWQYALSPYSCNWWLRPSATGHKQALYMDKQQSAAVQFYQVQIYDYFQKEAATSA